MVEAKHGGSYDQGDSYRRLCLSHCNVSPGAVTGAASSVGSNDHASRLRMRAGQDTRRRCLRGPNHKTPSPPARPQVRGVGRRECLRSMVLSSGLGAARRSVSAAEVF